MSEQLEKLVEKMRQVETLDFTYGDVAQSCGEAADALVRLWQERDEWKLKATSRRESAGKLFESTQAAEARVAELEAAIEHVVADSPGTPASVKQYLGAALAGKDSPDALDKWNDEELAADYWTDGPLAGKDSR